MPSAHDPASAPETLPTLEIAAGETLTLPARTYRYANIAIAPGGILSIAENARQWLILHCEGDARVYGTIVFRGFHSTTDPVEAQAPDGERMRHRFVQDNLGGDGGDGGSKGVGNRGGRGAHGTADHGGGGGGAGFNGRPNMQPGGDASAWRGGRSGGHRPHGDGGDGGRRLRAGNGGLLYLYVGGSFDATGGRIELAGLDGPAGVNGGAGTGGGAVGTGPAGGGGGAPGGEGGRLVVKAARIAGDLPTVNVQGGAGGAGGRGYRNGRAGEAGLAGMVDYL
ncbi:hypothetical protein HUS23_07005 [Ectothiorhodospiraceae bacterium 2226]|nr:hypothetical protein HUS23_07005 [Ectothiorhodospiraceae bacterium 2226]